MKLITGVPGSGKTELAVSMAQKEKGMCIYTSFSQENAKSAAVRFKESAHCMSVHALARRLMNVQRGRVVSHWGFTELNTALAANACELFDDEKELFISFFRSFLNSSLTPELARALTANAEFKLFSASRKNRFCLVLDKIWRWVSHSTTAPLHHDMYLKMASMTNLKLDAALLLVDEVQDLSDAMMAFIERLEKNNPDLEVILFGDKCQQIFGYRGVSNRILSMDVDTHLPYTNRFGNKVCALVNSFMSAQNLNYFVPIETKAPHDSEVSIYGGHSDIFQHAKNGIRLTYIARTNITLWIFASFLSSQGIRFSFKGDALKDIESLRKLWLFRSARAKMPSYPTVKTYSTLKKIAQSRNDDELLRAMKFVEGIGSESIFDDLSNHLVEQSSAQVLLTNVHQSKGLQFNHVFIADDFMSSIDWKHAKATKIPAEEAHLMFTALTRVVKTLNLPYTWKTFKEILDGSASAE